MLRGEWNSGTRLETGAANHGNTGRYYWYGDHSINVTLPHFSKYAIDRAGASYTPGLPEVQGGLYACSTTDFLSWRNEGIMVRATAWVLLISNC